jgi:hypothetical protein
MLDLADPKTDVVELYRQFEIEYIRDYHDESGINKTYDFKGKHLMEWLEKIQNVEKKDAEIIARKFLLIWNRNNLIKLSGGLIGEMESRYRHCGKSWLRRMFNNW